MAHVTFARGQSNRLDGAILTLELRKGFVRTHSNADGGVFMKLCAPGRAQTQNKTCNQKGPSGADLTCLVRRKRGEKRQEEREKREGRGGGKRREEEDEEGGKGGGKRRGRKGLFRASAFPTLSEFLVIVLYVF